MIWVLAFVAALLCAVLASEADSLFGFGAGFLIVAALGLVHRQSERIDELVDRLRELEKARAAAPRASTASPAPSPSTTPNAGGAPEPAVSQASAVDAFSAEPPPIPPSIELPSRPAPAAGSEPNPGRAERPTPVEAPAPTPPREAAPRPRVQRPAQEPDVIERFVERAKAFVFEGNVPVKLGLLVSLFGVAALIRYAASAGWLTVPVSVRYAGIAIAAIAMLLYGLKQVRERPVFGLSLQGGAIGILLLTVFGSFRVPGLLPAGLAFGLVLVLVAGAAVLAIRQNAVWLAVIGFLGGYLAPILLSTGSGNHVALFSYYALLNGAIFGMAWVRPWRALNLMGFVFTFGVAALWGAKYFRPELFATTEPFLVAFFLMYVTIPVAYALKGREPGKVDATLLFGTPLVAFPMQVALLDGETMPLAFSALAVAAVYLLLALWSRREEKLRVLGQSAAALGLAFATLAVPLALSARWTSATWALQGVALLWLGQTQQRRWPQAAGVGLQVLAGIAYLVSFEHAHDGMAVFNAHTLNVLLLVVGAGACAWLLDRADEGKRSLGGALLAAAAIGWWFWAGVREVEHAAHVYDHEGGLDLGSAWLIFVALSATVAAALRHTLDWRKPAWLAALALPTATLGVVAAYLDTPEWLARPEGLTLLAVTAAMVVALPTLRGLTGRLATAHIGGLAAITLALGLGIRAGLEAINAESLGDGWRWVLPWLPLAALTALLLRRPTLAAWPVGDAIHGYRRIALGLALLVLGSVWVVTQVAAGTATPLPWVPLLNPVELFQLVGVLALSLWLKNTPPNAPTRALASLALGVAAFTTMTMVTLRASLHWSGESMALSSWMDSVDWSTVASWTQSQAALSVVWSLAGVVCWVRGSRRVSRPLWTFGALLLGAVLLKLLLIDRGNLGDLLGIVSFLTVGGLLVVVGRLAPRPPSRPEAAA
ncbi:MAG: DUF2339 domain-containing protein [Silanimonas sp.]